MSEPRVWNGFTQAALDAAYNNMAACAHSTARLDDWAIRSDALRSRQPDELNIAYGPRPRNRFDMFRSGKSAASLLVFLHGGWWQRNSKEVFSCMAEGSMARGFDCALLGYTLAPAASLTAIVQEVRTGLDAVIAYQAKVGAAQTCVLSGWSAGGHLTAQCLDHPAVTSGLSVSGVFDLKPIRYSYINAKLCLDAGEVAALSPARQKPTGKPLILAFGLSELPELQRQSEDYGRHCAAHAAAVTKLPLANHDHFSILEELATPDGALANALSIMAK